MASYGREAVDGRRSYMSDVTHVNVFTHQGRGGNPCPIVADAFRYSEADMQAVASETGHESGFVLPGPSLDFDHRFRFWVPNHEMEMCGHATIGALWVLAKLGRLTADEVRISTLSGPVTGFISRGSDGAPRVEITQPAGKVTDLTAEQEADVLATLRLSRADLLDAPIQNAVTSRVKTLIPMRDSERLQGLITDVKHTETCCTRLGSTGLYLYAVLDRDAQLFEARQFPRSSGYPEDAATGIAAAALAFGLLRIGLIKSNDASVRVLQGRAMGCLSEISVRIGLAGNRAIGSLLGGEVSFRI
jgi:PhzF family phenazine biosynthesis protein